MRHLKVTLVFGYLIGYAHDAYHIIILMRDPHAVGESAKEYADCGLIWRKTP